MPILGVTHYRLKVYLNVKGIPKLNVRLFYFIRMHLESFEKQKTFIDAETVFNLRWGEPSYFVMVVIERHSYSFEY